MLDSRAHPELHEVPLRQAAVAVRFSGRSQVQKAEAEGNGRSGRNRLHFFRIAYASAKEIDSHMRLLARAGAVNRSESERALSTFDEVRAMTWRLINGRS